MCHVMICMIMTNVMANDYSQTEILVLCWVTSCLDLHMYFFVIQYAQYVLQILGWNGLALHQRASKIKNFPGPLL